jgi:hypothetical protein
LLLNGRRTLFVCVHGVVLAFISVGVHPNVDHRVRDGIIECIRCGEVVLQQAGCEEAGSTYVVQ